MPVMNATQMRDARKDKWLLALGGGVGFEWWQIAIGVVAGMVTLLLFFVIGQIIVGVFLAIPLAWFVAIRPNYMNTHHQDPQDYLKGRVRKRIQKTLVVNGKRVSEPVDRRERFVIEIREFPTSKNGDTHDP
jgi:hypothetical protein